VKPVRDPDPTIWQRIVGALFCAFFGAIMVMALPLIVVWYFPVKAYFGRHVLDHQFVGTAFVVWACVIVIYAAYQGFRWGIFSATDIFNQLWGTGETNDPLIRDAAAKVSYQAILVAIASLAIAALLYI
jgi:hypothetical protein